MHRGAAVSSVINAFVIREMIFPAAKQLAIISLIKSPPITLINLILQMCSLGLNKIIRGVCTYICLGFTIVIGNPTQFVQLR